MVVGSGPNGLAAAITLARAGRSVLVVEGAETAGGGMRSAELTLPGFVHDVCSAVHPLALSSSFFRSLPLSEHGLEWIQPELPVAHPLDDGTAVAVERSVEATAAGLGADGPAWRRLFERSAARWQALTDDMLRPVAHVPRHPVLFARFGLSALRSARGLAEARFKGERARAAFGGMAAHAMLPLESPLTASFGLTLGLSAHGVGWPIARGGSQSIADALISYLRSLGGELEVGRSVESVDELPPAGAVLLDVTPRQLLRLAGSRLPALYRRRMSRFRYGAGVFKVDYALDGPVPWRAEACSRTATVHLGGTLDEVAASERAAAAGEVADRPYVLVAQQTLIDPSRAPAGKHTLWAYCHLPAGSGEDMTGRIDAQIERFAPGFGERVLARNTMSPEQIEAHNPNYIGGDIASGASDRLQLLARPIVRLNPYTTPDRDLYICSASTPPGAGVHGMCGYWAARAALRRLGTGRRAA